MWTGKAADTRRVRGSELFSNKDKKGNIMAKSNKRVVMVLDRGWIIAGDRVRYRNGRQVLRNAVHVFRWEQIGFARMLTEWQTSKVVLHKMDHDPEIAAGTELFSVPVEKGWGLK